MMRKLSALALALLVASFAAPSRADLPPPPGQTRVDYSFEVDAGVDGSAIVAFPSYGSGDASNVQVIEAGRKVTPIKGWTPGIYLLPSGDVAGVPKGDQEAAKAYLEAHAKTCVKQVPRVYQIATETKVDKLHDVIHVDAKGGACRASLVKSLYTSTDGKKVDGGVDANGNRTAAPPIGKDLPSVSEAGFVGAGTAPPTDASPPSPSSASPTPSAAPSSSGAPAPSSKPGADPPPSNGCAGCALTEPTSRGAGALLAGGALALAIARRRRPRS